MLFVDTWLHAGLVGIVATILHLDRSVIFQSIFHRPVFLAPVCGALVGQTQVGLIVGVACEFVSLLAPPTGTDLPPDESAWAAVCMTSYIFAGAPRQDLALIMVLSMCALPVARNVERNIRLGNGRLEDYADVQAASGQRIPYKRLIFATVLGHITLYGALFIGLGYAVAALHWLLSIGPERWLIMLTGASLFVLLTLPAANLLKGMTVGIRPAWRGLAWGLGAVVGFAGWFR